MDASIEFNQSAFKHGITEENVRYAFAHAIFDHPLTDDEDKNLLVGFDMSANLIEIMYNVIDDRNINVFHAMKCRKIWRSFVNM